MRSYTPSLSIYRMFNQAFAFCLSVDPATNFSWPIYCSLRLCWLSDAHLGHCKFDCSLVVNYGREAIRFHTYSVSLCSHVWPLHHSSNATIMSLRTSFPLWQLFFRLLYLPWPWDLEQFYPIDIPPVHIGLRLLPISHLLAGLCNFHACLLNYISAPPWYQHTGLAYAAFVHKLRSWCLDLKVVRRMLQVKFSYIMIHVELFDIFPIAFKSYTCKSQGKNGLQNVWNAQMCSLKLHVQW